MSPRSTRSHPTCVVVLGGDEGAYETDRYPYLADEIELLRTRIDAEAPIFGVCLGAQLLAETLGARAYKGERKEVGWLAVEPTEPAHRLARAALRRRSRCVQWHGDTFDLPEGVERLAGSAQYENQAFARGDWLLAVQFHPEVDDARSTRTGCDAWGDELPEYGLTAEQLRAQRAEYGPQMPSGIRSPARRVPRGARASHRSASRRSYQLPTSGGAAGPSKKSSSSASGCLGLDSRVDLDAVVEPAVAQHVVERARGAGLLVPRAEHDGGDARREDRARAHDARLERDHERAVGEVPVAGGRGRRRGGRAPRRAPSGPRELALVASAWR